MAAPTRNRVLASLNGLLRQALVAAGVLLAVHVIPKPYAPRSGLRLLCTLGFFASSIYLCWLMTAPRSNVMHSVYQWRYVGSPPSIERTWMRYLLALDRATKVLGLSLMVFLGSTSVFVLSLWFHGVRALVGLAGWAWWGSLLVMLLAPFAGGFLVGDVWSRRRQLNEQLELTQWYKPRRWEDLFKPTVESRDRPAVRAIDAGSFEAGGVTWHWDDLSKNVFVFGQTGSGKTVCVLNAMMDGLFASSGKGDLPAGALVLDPKGDFRGKLALLLGRLGRKKDLLVIDPANPDTSIRWNPLDSPDDELEIAARFGATLEALGMKQQDSSFWVDSAKKFLRHAIKLLRLTNPPGVPPSLADVGELATSASMLVERVGRLDLHRSDADQCLAYFANEWAELADETRSSILAYLTNMIDPFLMEPYATLFSGRSTMRIDEMIRSGKILYVDMPIADKEAMARTVGTFVKLEYFREVLKVPDKSRPTLFLCDEFQSFFTTAEGKGDADFLARSRQSNHVNLLATQNLPGLLKQTPKEEPALNLLGNCAVKVFLRNTDERTNQYASGLFGQQLISMGGTQAAGGMGIGRAQLPGATDNVSMQDQFDSVVRVERFSQLAIPSRSHGVAYAEAIVHNAALSEPETSPATLQWSVHPIV